MLIIVWCLFSQYTLRCDMKRSLLAKDLSKTCEFMVHSLVRSTIILTQTNISSHL